MDLLHLFFKGGLVMYPILLASLISLTIAFERFSYYKKQQSKIEDFDGRLMKALRDEDYKAAQTLCEEDASAVGEVLLTALAERGGKARQEEIVQAAAKRKALELRRYLEYLSVIVTMAPLLGLLGTISGMISAFSVFNLQSGQATAITGGVGEALIATAMGLCVAIIALSVHAYFTQRIESIVTDMEQCFSLVEGAKDALSSNEGAAR